MDDPTYLKWTGTNASANKLVDEVNNIDRKKLNHVPKHYATGDIEWNEPRMLEDLKVVDDGRRLYLDTVTNKLTLKPGDTIRRTEEGWEIVT